MSNMSDFASYAMTSAKCRLPFSRGACYFGSLRCLTSKWPGASILSSKKKGRPKEISYTHHTKTWHMRNLQIQSNGTCLYCMRGHILYCLCIWFVSLAGCMFCNDSSVIATEDGRSAIFRLSGGDMRKVMNIIQVETYPKIPRLAGRHIFPYPQENIPGHVNIEHKPFLFTCLF